MNQHMTPQEIFNTVATHLRTQKHQAMNKSTGVCMYRAPNGTKCAVGVLIQDEEYLSQMEDTGVLYDLLRSNLCSETLIQRLSPHFTLLSTLQTIHDTCVTTNSGFDMVELEARLKRTAHKFDLVYSPPEST